MINRFFIHVIFLICTCFGHPQVYSTTTSKVFHTHLKKIFIETGSLLGDGIQKALDAGFEEVYSIELAPHYFDYCSRRFQGNPHVHLYQGDSSDVLQGLLEKIDEPLTFWLDGHFSSGDTAKGVTNTPILKELEIIANHHIKTHTILIDDIRLFGGEVFDFIEMDKIFEALKQINSKYIISYENGYQENDVLVAEIKQNVEPHIQYNTPPIEAIGYSQQYLPINPIIIDAGAYDGHEGAVIANMWPKGHVYSFEPIPEIYDRLAQTASKVPNMSIFNFALSTKDGLAEIYISEFVTEPGFATHSASLRLPKDHLIYAPHVTFPRSVTVETFTIDSWAAQNGIDHIDMMWLDMQGVELEVLKASPKMLANAKVIFIEVEFVEAYEGQYQYNDIKKWLEARGFSMIWTNFNPNNLTANGQWCGDALFVR